MTGKAGGPTSGQGPHGSLGPSGRVIGPYQVINLLGQGGMAAVYLARDSRDNQEVAVKVLARMRPSWVHRFSREFEAARKVDHPNVVRVLEAGESEGIAYYSMERIQGVTAARHVRGLGSQDPLPPPPPMDFRGPTVPIQPSVLDRTLRVAVQLARAVGAIHEVGIVHRDLKPGNVLVTETGIVKLVDFGVVKWLEELSNFTQVGHVVGSYSYMAPEQITGTQVDHRADTYGMGVLLYELLTGAPPFRAKRPQEYLWLHCTAQPDPVSRKLDGVPPALDALLLRMLAKEPADRPESMAHIEAELLRILHSGLGEQASEDARESAPTDSEVRFASHADKGPSTDEVLGEVTRDSLSDTQPVRARPRDATRPLDVSELQQLRYFEAKTREAEDRSPETDSSMVFEVVQSSPNSPTHPILSDELTERRPTLSTSNGQRPSGQEGAALASLVSPKHIGRKDEIEVLVRALRRARKAGIQHVLIDGEEGLGKTRLVQTFRGLAWVKGAQVAIGNCDAAGEAFCGAFQEILLRLVGPNLSRAHRERLLGDDKDTLYRFFPQLVPGSESPTNETLSITAGIDHSTLFRSVAHILRRSTEDGPLVIVLENVHSIDPGSARLAEALSRRLASSPSCPVLMVFTYRGEALQRDQAQTQSPIGLVKELSRGESCETLTLESLDKGEIAEVIRSLCVDIPISDEVVLRLAEASQGNPRYAVEVARSMIEDGGVADPRGDWELPSSLLAALEKRLAELPTAAREVTRCIAVLGGTPPVAIVRHAAGLSEHGFEAALAQLEGRRVVDVDRRNNPELVGLHSGGLRDAVLSSLTTNRARSVHRRAAAAWLKWAGRDPTVSGHVARHFYAAGEDRVAVPHALRAASAASEASDDRSLARWMALIGDLDDIISELPREMVHRYFMLRWQVAYGSGDLEDGDFALGQAASHAEGSLSCLETGYACARHHTRGGRYTEAVQVCRRGLREAREQGVMDYAVLFSIQGARAARRSGDLESALAWLAEADIVLGSAPTLGDLAVRTGWTRSAVLVDLGRSAEAEEQIHRALDFATRSGTENAEGGLRTNLSVLFYRRGAIDSAARELEQALAIFESLGMTEQVGLLLTNLATVRLHQGSVQRGRAAAEKSWRIARSLADPNTQVVAGAELLYMLRSTGSTEAGSALRAELAELDRAGLAVGEAGVRLHLEIARWHQGRGNLAIAWNHMGQATRLASNQSPEWLRLEASFLRVQLMFERSQIRESRELLDSIVSGCRRQGLLLLQSRAEALSYAVDCSMGLSSSPSTNWSEITAQSVPLRLEWLQAQMLGAEARGEPMEAQGYRRKLQEAAEQFGFADWSARVQ